MSKGITVVGLGPGDPSHLTTEAVQALQGADEVYLRTRQHPVVSALPAHLVVRSFDAVYEAGGSFEDVYGEIVERVLELGRRSHGVLYAVPGHPLVGENTVQRLLTRADGEDLPIRVVPGLSFIDAVLPALALDAMEGLQIGDALELARRYHPPLDPDQPALIGQLYDRQTAGDVKLTLLNLYPPEHEVTLVKAAGTPEQAVRPVPIYALDRQDGIDDLTSLYVPPLPRPASLTSLADVVAHLRSPEGCPWDREQTHQSLRSHLLEETYEVLAALDAEDMEALPGELGDLLLQVFMHAQMAAEGGDFTIADVAAAIIAKLVRRHPHVFGDVDVADAQEVLRNWEQLKQEERGEPHGALAGIEPALPALAQSRALQSRAARHGFDWPAVDGVWNKVEEELDELKGAPSAEDQVAEFGDLLFVLVNLARWLEVDAESALRQANEQFRQRFRAMERLSEERGVSLDAMTLEEMDELWEKIKAQED